MSRHETPPKIRAMVKELNKIGGASGIGRIDVVENRFVGMKSRGVYEAPGMTILYTAHRVIEQLTMDRDLMHLRDQLSPVVDLRGLTKVLQEHLHALLLQLLHACLSLLRLLLEPRGAVGLHALVHAQNEERVRGADGRAHRLHRQTEGRADCFVELADARHECAAREQGRMLNLQLLLCGSGLQPATGCGVS